MPIYMDRHDVSETVTAENVAQLHQQDLKIQHKFNCRGLTYWFDEKRNTDLNIINDPAFRTIMVIGLEIFSLKKHDSTQLNSPLQIYNKSIVKILNHFNGSIVKQNEDYFLVSFESVTKAVLCALEVNSKFKEFTDKIDDTNINLKIGLSAGVPVTEKDALFEETIKLAERM